MDQDALRSLSAKDQVDANTRDLAYLVANYYRALLDEKLPPELAAVLARETQANWLTNLRRDAGQ